MFKETGKSFSNVYFDRHCPNRMRKIIKEEYLSLVYKELLLIWGFITVGIGLVSSLIVRSTGLILDMIYSYLVLVIPLSIITSLIFHVNYHKVKKYLKRHEAKS